MRVFGVGGAGVYESQSCRMRSETFKGKKFLKGGHLNDYYHLKGFFRIYFECVGSKIGIKRNDIGNRTGSKNLKKNHKRRNRMSCVKYTEKTSPALVFIYS